MDHIVYVDAKASELEKLLDGTKTTIIRGAAGRKMPYGRVNPGDVLYLINNNAEGLIRAKAKVENVFNSEKMTKKDSTQLVSDNQEGLQLTPQQINRWAGKRYLVIIEVGEISELEPFSIDKSDFGNMDDWLLVENIKQVKITR